MAIESSAPRSRRALLAAATGGLAALVAQALGRPLPARGADGDNVRVGRVHFGTRRTVFSYENDEPVLLARSFAGGVGFKGWSATGYGVWGISDSNSAVYGDSATGFGVQGISDSNAGVRGISTSGYGVSGNGAPAGVYGASGSGAGVYGTSSSGPGVRAASTDGRGVSATSGTNYGVYAQSASSYGVFGRSTSSTAVYGRSDGSVGVLGFGPTYGVQGETGTGSGVYGTSVSGYGVYGTSTSGTGVYGTGSTAGVWGINSGSGWGVAGGSTSGIGVIGGSSATNRPATAGFSYGGSTGVQGYSGGDSVPAAPTKTGVYGYAAQDANARGVTGRTTAGRGVNGTATTGRGVFGYASTGIGVYATCGVGGVALQTEGPVNFSSAGLATIAAGSPNVSVVPGIDLASDTKVLCTLQGNPGAGITLSRVAVHPSADTFTIYLTAKAGADTPVAWFVVGGRAASSTD